MYGKQLNEYITLKINSVDRKFYSFWLKDVSSVNLKKHCINCLVGHRYKEMSQYSGFEMNLNKNKIYYLCGVTYPYVWENNFHLAFRYKEGKTINLLRKGVSMTVKNAEEIHFSENDIDKSVPESKDRKFYTCRNWQFANYFKKNLGKEVKDNNPQQMLW